MRRERHSGSGELMEKWLRILLRFFEAQEIGYADFACGRGGGGVVFGQC